MPNIIQTKTRKKESDSEETLEGADNTGTPGFLLHVKLYPARALIADSDLFMGAEAFTHSSLLMNN